jgi:MOSC domain-containing protein YiiM
MNHLAFPLGVFGENFTVKGTIEAELCLRETWQVNNAAFLHVSRPH